MDLAGDVFAADARNGKRNGQEELRGGDVEKGKKKRMSATTVHA